MSIHNIWEKIKGYGGIDKTGLLYVFLVLGVGIASFELGRLSMAGFGQDRRDNGNIIIYDTSKAYMTAAGAGGDASLPSDQPEGVVATAESGSYVASKSGKLYYTASCSGAKRILDKNKVWFDTAGDAEKSGYTRATSCK
jgi:hypothetical protein